MGAGAGQPELVAEGLREEAARSGIERPPCSLSLLPAAGIYLSRSQLGKGMEFEFGDLTEIFRGCVYDLKRYQDSLLPKNGQQS